MIDHASQLAAKHLSVVSRTPDPEIAQISARIAAPLFADGRGELERLLCELMRCEVAPTPKTLDLVGHSTAGSALLVLGDWVIDAASSTVLAFFRELAEQDVFPRLGITALRLLGCLTADTNHGRMTLCALSDILGVEVYGTTALVFANHYDAEGFAYDRRYLLVSATELRNAERDPVKLTAGDPHERVLDLDALPSAPLLAFDAGWPLKSATRDEASALLRLVRRRAGATMPGLLTSPRCEVAMPSAMPGHYHRAQVLLDGELIRVYPDGANGPGIVYPVDDATALLQIIDQLPLASRSS